MADSYLVTAVIGAGPSGLLFCVISRILYFNQGGKPEDWSIYLFDKREQYIRTHRLRIAPEPYYAIQKELKNEQFDGLIDFLKEHHFSPTVNLLEEKLEQLANSFGVFKENLWIGEGKGKFSIAELRQKLESECRLKANGYMTIVAADSVHSTIREAVKKDNKPIKFTHQTVARLRVYGENLPSKIGVVAQYKLSKVLHSIVDYRLNSNGFAEIDLFLDSTEHHHLEELGSSPKNPLLLNEKVMDNLNAPLFSRFIYHLNKDITDSHCDVYLQSTFRLEHQYMEKITFSIPELKTDIFLVGDAAISLPFFRGMACLAGCAKILAQAHYDIASKNKVEPVSVGSYNPPLSFYENEVRKLRLAEISTVNARARLIRFAREFCRISTFLPFPLQTWFLSFPEPDNHTKTMTAGLVFNSGLALLAGISALVGPILSQIIHPDFFILWIISLIIQIAGGVVYRAAQEFEPGNHKDIKDIWRFQIAILFIIGVAITAYFTFLKGTTTLLYSSLSWFILGMFFVIGIYIFEGLGNKWFKQAKFEE